MDSPANTVAHAFAQSAARFGDRPFLCVLPETAALYGVPAGETGYAPMQSRIESWRAAYAAAGYGHGHRVGLLLENRPAFFLHWFALNGLGVSVVPINPDLRSAELEYLIGHSEIALAVALPSRHEMLHAAAQAAGRAMPVMAPDDTPVAAAFAAPREHDAVGETTECALLYTSGTTGRPKGCILPNRYFLHAGAWYAAIGGLAELRAGEERMLTPLPLVHMNAMAYSTMAMLLTGGCLVPLDRFHPGSWWDSVRESRATVVHYLGVMPAMLMKAAPSDRDREHDVRFGFGAGVDRGLHAAFEQRFAFPLLEAWAMTETGAGAVVIANREPRRVGTSCFGREGDDVEVKLIADSGEPAGVDEPAELLVRHAGGDPRDGFFAGYLKDEAATDEAWAGGWFHTGDIVRRGADGQLHFIDRRKNVIRRSGENISAVEVESVLLQHPRVKAAAVAAVPDAVRGDEVLACIVGDGIAPDGQARHAAAADIVDWCLARLAYYKAPGYVAFVDALPLTTSQKVQRGELRAMAAALVGQANCIATAAMKKRTMT
ncbi:AMP-binding protein [Piscinibacter sp. XHJ-5]|uniref:AMP-binding protein n=1 Tax=Piscinibacter sp. XHJ-5 TaxID=3037797 RepID=UPI002452981A|nr:AMP-binding protein [Piscinibacter sp. XHJ-5]